MTHPRLADGPALTPPQNEPPPDNEAAPQNELEQRLREIWSEVLGTPVLDVTATLTDLGGNSIAAARIAARIKVRLGARVDLAAILRFRSIRALAASIDWTPSTPVSVEDIPLVAAANRDALPMSFFQEWRFRADQGLSAPLYSIAIGYELHGDLRVGALRDALSELARRHEPLRTNYDVIDSRYLQVIHEPKAVDLPVLDVRGSAEDGRRAEALRLLEAEAAQRIDRRNGAIFQPMLAQFADDRYLLMLRLDRITVDGTACAMLEQDLTTLYSRFVDGVEPPDPPTLQQADWAAWQRQHLRGQRLDDLVKYWRGKLDASRPLIELRLPSGIPTPQAATFRGRSEHRQLGLELSAELRRRAREADVTLFMYVLAALKTFIARLCAQEEATVLCPFANRVRPELEQLVGSFSHGVVYRTDLSGDPSFGEIVTRVRDVCLEAWEHQELPVSEVVKHVRPTSYLTLYDEFHVFFDVVRDEPLLQLSHVEVQPTFVGTGAAHPSLAVLVDDGGEDLTLIMRGDADRFDAPALQWVIDAFVRLLTAAVRDPQQRASRLPPLAEAVRQRFEST